MKFSVIFHLLILTLSFLLKYGHCQCTFPTNMVGTWTSNAFGTITVASNYLNLGTHRFEINGKTSTNWTCYSDATSPYLVLQSELFQFSGDDTYGYICMNATEVNVNSFYFYMQSPTQTLFSNERVVLFAAASTPGNIVSSTCTAIPSTAEFISMVRTGSEESAVVDCPDPLHRNFTYILNKGSGDVCTTDSFLSVCPSRQELEFDYSKCADTVLFSANGRIGCTATIIDGSGTQYASLYNFDTTVNNLLTFRFSCAAVQDAASGDIQVSYNLKRCEASQSYSAIPSDGGRLTLTPNGTCEIMTTTEATTTEVTTEEETTTTETTESTTVTTTESPIPVLTTDSVNIGAIIGGVLAAILFIFLLLFIILYCCHRQKVIAKQREIIDRRLKLFKIKQSQGLDDDEKVLMEPSLDPDFPQTWQKPVQEPIPPVTKTITRDMMSQTDLRKEPKKKVPPPPIIEKPPEHPTPKYLQWPWRSAKRALLKSQFQSQTDLNKFGPLTERQEETMNLASYTLKKYGIQYDETGVEINEVPRPPTRFIPHTNSALNFSRASSRASLSRSKSLASLNRSHSMMDLTTPTPRKVVHLTRTPSLHSLRSFTERTQTNVLMSIQEKKDSGRETEHKAIYNNAEELIRPIPHYMFPIRSNTVTKFDKTKHKNPLAIPLKRSKTEMRPIPGNSKKVKSKNKKKKKIKVKKTSPYAVGQKPAPRQVTLIPLSLQKSSKVKPGDIKQKPKKVAESPDTTSPKTLDSDIKSMRTTETYIPSPDTAISSVNTESLFRAKELAAEVSKTEKTLTEPMPMTASTARVKSERTTTTDYQDSGISADESSLDNPKSDSATDSELKFPKINVPKQPDGTSNKPKVESLKLPFIEKKQKPSVHPWR